MFAEVKGMLPVSGDGYDAEIITQIKACVRDLTATAEIVLPGTVSIKRTLEAATTSEPEHYVITDTSSLKDEYVIAVIATWCNMRIGNPPNYDNLLKAYESMKGSMRLSKQYTRYRGGADECGC
ncbi:MAG: hypothetical protein J6U26_00255 [Lachnospiraceae bacterium]|nr:hypothetical protein [Lachnospiraceae bacterium]